MYIYIYIYTYIYIYIYIDIECYSNELIKSSRFTQEYLHSLPRDPLGVYSPLINLGNILRQKLEKDIHIYGYSKEISIDADFLL